MQRMLAVDDEQAILLALQDYFGARGFEVDCARSLEEACAHLEQSRYGLVITDLRLDAEGQEGLDVVQFVRERSPEVVAILLTAHGSPEIEAEAQRRGADVVVSKPIALKDLAHLALGLVERSRCRASTTDRHER